VPVATSLRGTLPRLVHERRCGVQFDAADPQALAALIRTLRDDPVHCAELGSNAQRTFSSDFVAEKVYARLIERLEAIATATNPQLAVPAQQPAVIAELRSLKPSS
jgi:glycosyltransferase involved in cell wall biosynthesis